MANIELKIVAVGDFKPVISQLSAMEAQVKSVNASMMQMGRTLSGKEAAQYSSVLIDSIKASNLFRVETIKSATAAENLGKRITSNKITMSDLRTAMRGVGKETSIYNQLAQRQIAMQDATIVKTKAGNVVIAQQGVNMKNTAIRARVLTEELRAQNAALHQGAINIINWGKNTQWAGRQLTYGITMPIAMLGAGMAKVFMDVNSNMTRLSKVYGVSGKVSKDTIAAIQKDVLNLSKTLSKELGISAKDVTDIAAEFAAAGYEGTKLIEATRQASRAVVLGETDKASAVKATISLQSAYKLSMSETTDAMNFFNAAQAATSTTMNDLINAIPRVGPIVKQLGGTYKDTVAILTAMKEGGIPVGEAANAIKTSLARIINPTKAAQDRLKGFGIDIKGIVSKNAGDLTGTLIELQKQLNTLSGLPKQQALAELFGKQQFGRMSAFIENFGQGQSAQIVKMMGLSATELASIADEQTKKIQQSASGRFKIVVESLKNSLLPVGEATLNLFTDLLERMKDFFDYLMNLPTPIKAIFKALGGLALLSGPVLMFAGLFANLGGFIAKMGITVRNLFIAFSKNLNPMESMRSKWKEYTAEMKVADSTVDKITASQDAGKAAMNAMTLAIEHQIQALGKLSAQSASASADQMKLFQQMQSLMQMQMFPMFSSTSGSRITGETRQHMLPKSELFKMAGVRGDQKLIRTWTNDKNKLSDLSMAGSLFGSAIGTTEINQKIIGTNTAIQYTGSAASDKEITMLKTKAISLLRAKNLSDEQINEALRQTFTTDKEMLAVETRSLAQREIILNLSTAEKNLIASLSEGYQKELALEDDAVARQRINAAYQTRINEIFSARTDYQDRVYQLELEYGSRIEAATTLQDKKAIMNELILSSFQDELASYTKISEELDLGFEQSRNLVFTLRGAAQAGGMLEASIIQVKNDFIKRVRAGYKGINGSPTVTKSQLTSLTESSFFNELNQIQRDAIKASISLNRGKDLALLDAKGNLIGIYNLAAQEIRTGTVVDQQSQIRLDTAKNSLAAEYEAQRAWQMISVREDRARMLRAVRGSETNRIMSMIKPGTMSAKDEASVQRYLGTMSVTRLRKIQSGEELFNLPGSSMTQAESAVAKDAARQMREAQRKFDQNPNQQRVKVGNQFLTREQLRVARYDLIRQIRENEYAPGEISQQRFAGVRAAYREAGGGARGVMNALRSQRGLAMGAGMGIMMGGSLLSSGMQEGALGKQTLSAASMGAGMGMMFGPEGAAIGAAAGALVGIFQELGAAAERTAAGLRSTLGASKEEFAALGLTINPITTNLPGFNDKLNNASSAVDSFRKSIQDAADASEQKQFVEKLRGAGADQKKIDELLRNKAEALATGGASKEQVGTAIKAYMAEAGVVTTNFNVNSLFDKAGKMIASVPAQTLMSALKTTGLTGSGQFIANTIGQGYTPGSAGAGTSVGNFMYASPATNGTDAGQINAIAESLKVPLQGLLNSPDLASTIASLKEIENLDFTKATIGGTALNQTITDMVGDSEQLKELNTRLTNLGVEPADKLYYLSAAINGVVTNLDTLASMPTVEVKLTLDVAAASNIVSSDISNLASQVKDNASGATANAKATSGIENKIKAEQKLIDAIKEVQAQRQKELDLQKQSLDFEKEKLGLQNQLRDAMASGNLLKAAEIRQQIAISGANRTNQVNLDKQTEAENASIKKHEDKIAALNAQKDALSAVTTSTLSASRAATTAADKYNTLTAALKDIASNTKITEAERVKQIESITKKLKALGLKSKDISTLVADIMSWGQASKDLARTKANDARNNGDSIIPVGRLGGLATGGYVSGPGTATSDSVLARLSNGEFVMSASAVKHYGVSALNAMNENRYAMGGLVSAYANGGFVVPQGVSNYSGSGGGASINNTFYISGADPSKVADEVMKKINVTMKKTGAVVRV